MRLRRADGNPLEEFLLDNSTKLAGLLAERDRLEECIAQRKVEHHQLCCELGRLADERSAVIKAITVITVTRGGPPVRPVRRRVNRKS